MEGDVLYSITELASATGVSPRAIRFYESKGLLTPRRIGTTRVYDYRDRGRLKLIMRGKELGFTLADISEYLDLYDTGARNLEQQQHLLAKVRERISRLQSQRLALEKTLEELVEIERYACEHLQAQGLPADDSNSPG